MEKYELGAFWGPRCPRQTCIESGSQSHPENVDLQRVRRHVRHCCTHSHEDSHHGAFAGQISLSDALCFPGMIPDL